MDQELVFKIVQKNLENVPLVLIGTGGTIPYGIPGMSELAFHLIDQLDLKYKSVSEWIKFQQNLSNGKDLETALTGLNIPEHIMSDIARYTWELITLADLQIFYKIVNNEITIAFCKMFEYMCKFHPKQLKIITTNYDRIIEYACDQSRLSINVLASGCYLKHIDTKEIKPIANITLLKVHGSLDWFENEDGYVYSIPLQNKIPEKMNPKIIPPGSEKYRSIAQPPCRDVIHLADDYIGQANSFLCIGYGFNDEQIQTNIISSIRCGKPIVVVTKNLSEKSLEVLNKNSNNYIAIQESDKFGYTDFITLEGKISIEGNYWKISEFMSILN